MVLSSSKGQVLLVACLLVAGLLSHSACAEEQASYLKSWKDWARAKVGAGSAPVKSPQQVRVPGAKEPESWSSWALDKVYSFSGQASKNADEGKQYGKEKVKEGERAATHASQDTGEKLSATKDKVVGSASESKEELSRKQEGAKKTLDETLEKTKEKGQETKGKAQESGEKAKSFAGKSTDHAGKAAESLKDSLLEQAGKGYETVKGYSGQAADTVKGYSGQAADKAKEELRGTREVEL